tara:strand:- start:566 stop:1285 length:720 start_codon:yes stop_codon:yes gene_type:complete
MKLCVIPARGGSKRIPKKNIKDFFGKPLISYSIKVALESNLFERVIVSTDDLEIAEISKEFGAEIPFIRPKELSDDHVGLEDVIDHAFAHFENLGERFEYICTIYATAPFIKKTYINMGYEALRDSDAINAFSCTSMPFPIQRTFKINKQGRCEMFTPEHYQARSQDLEEAFHDAGQFCWTNKLRQEKNKKNMIYSEVSIPITVPRNLVQDIDTPEDWIEAELLFEILKKKQKHRTIQR